MAIKMDTEATRRDAAIPCYGRGLYARTTNTRKGETPVMGAMPGDDVTVLSSKELTFTIVE